MVTPKQIALQFRPQARIKNLYLAQFLHCRLISAFCGVWGVFVHDAMEEEDGVFGDNRYVAACLITA